VLIREDRGSESPPTEENTRIGIGVSSYRSGRQKRRKYKIGDRNLLPQKKRTDEKKCKSKIGDWSSIIQKWKTEEKRM